MVPNRSPAMSEREKSSFVGSGVSFEDTPFGVAFSRIQEATLPMPWRQTRWLPAQPSPVFPWLSRSKLERMGKWKVPQRRNGGIGVIGVLKAQKSCPWETKAMVIVMWVS